MCRSEADSPRPRPALAPALGLAVALLAQTAQAGAQQASMRLSTPVRQATGEPVGSQSALTIREASRPDRWFGQEVRDVRWAPDGAHVYFRWSTAPEPDEDPDSDPWFRVDRRGTTVEQVPAAEEDRTPGAELSWSRDGRRAAWVNDGRLHLYDALAAAPARTRLLLAAKEEVQDVRLLPDGSAVDFMLGEDLYRQSVETGALRQLSRKHVITPDRASEARRWLAEEQMTLFRYPGVYAAGVSSVGVTDWAHYSDGWTSPILNLPAEDPEAFRVSSPIYYAEGLQDALLISHGLLDSNVHFQDAARLVQRLIELEKDFEVMYYPLEGHGFRTESSRYDYHRRVAAHFEKHLLRRGAYPTPSAPGPGPREER